jgi:hypothetical protein
MGRSPTAFLAGDIPNSKTAEVMRGPDQAINLNLCPTFVHDSFQIPSNPMGDPEALATVFRNRDAVGSLQ